MKTLKTLIKWRVDFGFRDSSGYYREQELFVIGENVQTAIITAVRDLQSRMISEEWKTYKIYNVGLMGDCGDEVC